MPKVVEESHLTPLCVDNSNISRHAVSTLNFHKVSYHQLVGINLRLLSISYNGGLLDTIINKNHINFYFLFFLLPIVSHWGDFPILPVSYTGSTRKSLQSRVNPPLSCLLSKCLQWNSSPLFLSWWARWCCRRFILLIIHFFEDRLNIFSKFSVSPTKSDIWMIFCAPSF